tara:strand:- start:223 stop:675 length:453 start_codon:yes stop_codon:yes gene_type:complete
MLRQQEIRETKDPLLSLADFVAPPGEADHLGMFATSIFGAEVLAAKYDAELDDYNKIMSQALADRLAEAFAELLHKRIRTELWGYSSDEELSEADLLKIKYDGIRPAPGYPSQPDHTEKTTMWEVCRCHNLLYFCAHSSFLLFWLFLFLL